MTTTKGTKNQNQYNLFAAPATTNEKLNEETSQGFSTDHKSESAPTDISERAAVNRVEQKDNKGTVIEQLASLSDEGPNSETIERAISGPPQPIRCPQCGGPAALSIKESGKYYCQGACSYGDNFYFSV